MVLKRITDIKAIFFMSYLTIKTIARSTLRCYKLKVIKIKSNFCTDYKV